MKKTFSVILSLIIVVLSVSQGFYAFAQDSENKKLYNFAQELSQMVRENDKNIDVEDNENIEDLVASADKFYGNSVEVDFDDGISDDAFATQRLIVKSKKLIDYQGAIDCVSGYNDLYILQYDTEFATKIAYDYYLNCDHIEYVEPDIIMSTQEIIDVPTEVPDIGDVSEMNDITAEAIEWLSEKIGFSDIKDKLAEKIQDDYILVAVLDSGVDTDHEYFENRLVYSEFNASDTGEANSVEDDYGHGTHVTGIIVGNTLENVKIKPYKVLNEKGNGSLSTISIAVDMAVAEGADIINMSLSGQGESQRMTEAVNNAVANDVNVVVAAGNKHADLDNVCISPACIESAITVSATDKFDRLASFSNYDGTIDIAAPGEDIKSCYLNNTYTSMSGTSMAAPQVTAGLAIILSVFADKPAIECEEMIKDFAIAMHENEGENHFGAGLLFLKYLLDGKPTTVEPVFSVDSCTFTESFKLEITCPEKDADIYYLIYNTGDWDNINLFDGLEYTSPITISVDTKIATIAIGKGKAPSSIIIAEYDRLSDSEENDYDINMLGFITGYFGTDDELVIPEIINGKTVKGIASNAFEGNDFVRTIVLPDSAEEINLNAFSGCKKLESISGDGIVDIGVNAFVDCERLTDLDFPNLEKIGEYAFSGSMIREISFPNVFDVDINAFNGCNKLETVVLPSVETISIGAFRDCTSLKTVDIGSATKVGANAFRNTGIEKIKLENIEEIGNYAFADNPNLTGAYFPNVESTGAYVFQNCTALKSALLPKLEEVNSNLFKNCSELKVLYLPSVKNVVKNGFAGSSIEYLKFDCIETIRSLPDALSSIILPSTLSEISASVPSSDFCVYGYPDTYAEQYANDNNKAFYSVPAIVYYFDDEVNAEDGYIFVYAQGFNCTYQWYKNDLLSNEDGTLIEGATSCVYVPSREDKAESYYCVITSDDGINVATITTKTIANAPEYKDADYTEFYALYEEYQQLDQNLYKDGAFDEVNELFKTDVSQYSLAEQDTLNALVEKIKDLIANAELKYILCDINADSKITILDARLALKAVVGSYTLDKTQTLAADVNGDGKVSIADSRAILKSVLDQ